MPANPREWIFLAAGLVFLVSVLIFSGDSTQTVPETISSQDLSAEISDMKKAEPTDVEKDSDVLEQKPYTFKITGLSPGNSYPFPLNRGNYEISYQTCDALGSFAYLKTVNGDRVVDRIFSEDKAVKGTNYIYNIEPGLYYLLVAASRPSCSWEVEFVQN